MNDTEQGGWSKLVNDPKSLRIARIVLLVIVLLVVSIVTLKMTGNSSSEKLTYVSNDISLVSLLGRRESCEQKSIIITVNYPCQKYALRLITRYRKSVQLAV